jgi:hypothetical protein
MGVVSSIDSSQTYNDWNLNVCSIRYCWISIKNFELPIWFWST